MLARITSTFVAAIVALSTVGSISGTAFAGDRHGGYHGGGYHGGKHYRHGYYPRRHYYSRDRYYRHRHRDNTAAILGFGIGAALLGSAIAAQNSRPRYYAAPTYYAAPQPWSGEWYRYCAAKYRSFNPKTGYFLAYSGQYKFCR